MYSRLHHVSLLFTIVYVFYRDFHDFAAASALFILWQMKLHYRVLSKRPTWQHNYVAYQVMINDIWFLAAAVASWVMFHSHL